MSCRIPKSKAKTAYGLLGEIKRLILEEPKRYAQRLIRVRGAQDILSEFDKVPSCGTVGCVAGWTITLKHPKVKVPAYGRAPLKRAAKILGLSLSLTDLNGRLSGPAWELFAHRDDDDLAEIVRGAPQTRAHAKAGAAHIEAFRQKYAKQLKAKAV